MTSFGQYGGTHYQSPTEKSLGSITVESYEKVYDDQAKFMSKLAGDVSYLASNDKKQQAGIDKANENFIQQFQDMINDIIVLLGGGGNTGFDFGDLRYVIIAIGALFGFTDGSGKINVPLNLFQAAWHFFSNYLLPVDNFRDAIDIIIDEAIATVLDLFGEVPIVGQALQQFAVIVSDIRDLLDPIANVLQTFFGIFTIDPLSVNAGLDIGNYFGPLKPIWDMFTEALSEIELPDFTIAFHKFATAIAPVIDDLADILDIFIPMLTLTSTDSNGVTSPIIQLIQPLIDALSPYLDILVELILQLHPILHAIVGVINMFMNVTTFPLDFIPADAIANFVTNWINPVSLTNSDVITELLNGLNPISLTDTGVIGEILGGLTGNQWFIDLVNILGAVGLGTGAVTFLSNIPVIAPIINTLAIAWGGIGSSFSLDQLELYATSIGNQFVQGLLGGATVGDTIQNQADAIVQGVYQNLGLTGNNFATVTGALKSFSSYLGFNLFGSPPDNSVAGQGIINNLYISKQAVYKPISIAIDQSTDAPYNITDIVTVANANGGTLPTPIVMHSGDAPVGCFIPTIHAGNKRSIKFMGNANGPIDEFYISVYKFDKTTSTSQLVYASPNFGPYISASVVPIWYGFNISDLALINTSQEDMYYIALNQNNGQATPSTFTLVGLDHYIDNQPNAVPATFGATGGWVSPVDSQVKSADPPALSYNVNKAIPLTPNDNAVVAMAVIYSTTTPITGVTATLATSGGTVPMTLAYLSPNISANGDYLYIAMFTHKGTAGVAPYTGVSRQINVVATGGTGKGIAISAASFPSVSAFGAAQTNSGISASPALTVPGITSGVNVVGFASDNGNFTAVNENWLEAFDGQTRMYPNSLAAGWGFNGNQVFSATLAASSHWLGVGIPVLSSLGLQDISLDANPWYADSSPWIGFGCDTATSGEPQADYTPVVIPIYESAVWENPTLIWPQFNYFDFIVAGAGAGGDAGGFFQGAWGGACGSWAGTTLSADEMGTDNITWNIGAPGPGGSSVGVGGGSGSGSSVTIPAVGTLAASGGTGRGSSLLTGGNLAGRGQDNPGYSFDGDDFPGAAGGNAGQGAGNQPGSGGGGGNAFNTYGQNVLGGPGGPGIGWIVGYRL